jgi:predicted NBD/HSP70 family sugar kinase
VTANFDVERRFRTDITASEDETGQVDAPGRVERNLALPSSTVNRSPDLRAESGNRHYGDPVPVDPWIGPRGSAARRLLAVVRERGPLTRPELARLTGMSESGVRPLVARLVASGELIERDASADRRAPGRPGTVLTATVPEGVVLGLDFGHAHVGVGVADLGGAQLAWVAVPLDVDSRAEEALDTAARLTARALGDAGRRRDEVVRAVAGVPGPVDRAGRMRSPTIVSSWWGLPIADEVAARLGLNPQVVEVENDAHLGALGERAAGVAVGCDDFVYVKASHGLGAGLVLRGELYAGASGLTGELGHTVVEPDGALCRCGSRGCLETVVAIGRVREQIRFVAATDEVEPLAELVELPAARRIVVEAGRTLGRALADVANLLDPDRIVLGGELAAAGAPLVEGVRESIGRYAQPAVAGVEVVLGTLGERAQVTGATALAAARARAAAWAS